MTRIVVSSNTEHSTPRAIVIGLTYGFVADHRSNIAVNTSGGLLWREGVANGQSIADHKHSINEIIRFKWVFIVHSDLELKSFLQKNE